MINWDREGGGDLTKFLRANKAKREEKIRKINIFLGHSQNIWGDFKFYFPYFSLFIKPIK